MNKAMISKAPAIVMPLEQPADNRVDESAHAKITMTTLGKTGYFGDQLMQYAFLRIYARAHNADAVTPAWVGDRLFTSSAVSVSAKTNPLFHERTRLGVDAMLPVITAYLGVNWKNLLGMIFKKEHASTKDVSISFLNENTLLTQGDDNPCNDLLGWFQFHTRSYAPYRDFFRSLFQPVKEIEQPLLQAWQETLGKGTIIGVHLRRGDRLKLPFNTNEWVAPISWYKHWLKEHWHTFDNPRLFIASDSIEEVRQHLLEYQPITSADIVKYSPVTPHGRLDKIAPFYPDFFFLSLCDINLSSNSMFSFVACMLNTRGNLFLRPVLEKQCLVPFDPWDSKPILRRKMYTSSFDKYREYIGLSYLAGGMAGVCKSLFIRIPRFWLLRGTVNTVARLYGSKIRFRFESY